jgi:maltooligosyltrehalose synthase
MQNNIVAFARRAADKWAVIMAGRFFTQVLKEGDSPAGRDAWKETVCLLPDGGPVSLRNVVTGHEVSSEGAISAGDVFTHIPVALLINE